MTATPDPLVEYERRLTGCRAQQVLLALRDERISYARLLTFVAAAIVAWLAWRQHLAWWWLAVPFGVFLALVIVHDRVIRARRRLARIVDWYERGIARIEDRWTGIGEPGSRFRDDSHPFAADLDLFGDGSLFQLLNTSQTRAGEETLAQWLCAPASRDIALGRQEAVRDLTRRTALREDLATAGVDVRAEVDPDALATWATGPRVLADGSHPIAADRAPTPSRTKRALGAPAGGPGWRRVAAPVLALCALLAAVAWWSGVTDRTPFLLMLLVNGLFGVRLRPRAVAVLHAAADPARELATLEMVLERIERESFSAARLRELRQTIEEKGEEAVRTIRRLRWIVEVHDWQHNIFFAPIGALLLLNLQCAFAIEAWRKRHGHAVAAWLRMVGELEALASLAAYAYEHPSDPFPEIVPAGETPIFEAECLAHPLIPRARAVSNDIRLGAPDTAARTPDTADTAGRAPAEPAPAALAPALRAPASAAPAGAAVTTAAAVLAAPRAQALIVSGSNMSGKSTLLRSVGINAVLALAGAPVRATRLQLSPMAIGATLRIQDSLQAGRSRFYAEITRVRELVDMARASHALLFLLDELFHGTNSHDRVAGAQGVLKSLLDLHAIGLVTTHDLALATIGDELAPRVANVHFDDSLVDGEMHFDYRLKPGPVTRSNALALMKAVGLDVGRG